MCGRYQLGMTWEELLEHYRIVQEEFDRGMFTDGGSGEGAAGDGDGEPVDAGALAGIDHGGDRTPLGFTLPWFNQAPGQPSPAVFAGEDGLRVDRVRWGFPPLWVRSRGKDPWKERPLVNAKAEEARGKRTWSKPFAERRCLVPTTGFYEWVRRDGGRFPLHFRPPGGGILTLGGIFTAYEGDRDQPLICMSILTTGPNAVMAPVHDRMPVVVARQDWQAWLDADTDDDVVDGLCGPAPDDALEAVEASTALNSWKAAGAEVLQADWTWEQRR